MEQSSEMQNDCDGATNRESAANGIDVVDVESSGEESGPEIEEVQEEEMFDFCLDQLFNGDTREERQEARDLMVDNFDELSMYLVDAMDEIVRTGRQGGLDRYKQNINQLEGYSHRKRKRNSTSLKHEYRNYRMEVKKNHPDKYNKYLQNRRDYEKRRLEQMTDKKKKAFLERKREYSRKYRRIMSLEQKTKERQRKNEWQRQQRLESEGRKKKEREYNRKYYQNMSEEKMTRRREKDRDYRRRKRQNMTKVERKAARQKKAEGK